MHIDDHKAAEPAPLAALTQAYGAFASHQRVDKWHKHLTPSREQEPAAEQRRAAEGALNTAIAEFASQFSSKKGPLHPVDLASEQLIRTVKEQTSTMQKTAGDAVGSLVKGKIITKQAMNGERRQSFVIRLTNSNVVLGHPDDPAAAFFPAAIATLKAHISHHQGVDQQILKAALSRIQQAQADYTQSLDTAQQAIWQAAGEVAHVHTRDQRHETLAAAIAKASHDGHIDHLESIRLTTNMTRIYRKHLQPPRDFKAFDAAFVSLCRRLMYGSGTKACFSTQLHIHVTGYDFQNRLLRQLHRLVKQAVNKVPGIDTEDARSRLEGIRQLPGEDLEALVQAQRGLLDQAAHGLMKLMMLALTTVLVVGAGVAALAAGTGISVAGVTLGVAASLYALPKLWKGFFNGIAAGSYALSDAIQNKKNNLPYVALLGISIVQSATLAVGWSAQCVGQLGVFVDAGCEKISKLVQHQLSRHQYSKAEQRIKDFGSKLDAIDVLAESHTFAQQTQALLGSLGQTVTGAIGGVLAAGCAAFAGLGQWVSTGIQQGMHEEAGARLHDACQSALGFIGKQLERMTQTLREDPAQWANDLQHSIRTPPEPIDISRTYDLKFIGKIEMEGFPNEFKSESRRSSYI